MAHTLGTGRSFIPVELSPTRPFDEASPAILPSRRSLARNSNAKAIGAPWNHRRMCFGLAEIPAIFPM
jgi:hypothetical protein